MSKHTISAETVFKEKLISKTKSEISLGPLQKGFGHTIGYALRRVLISSLTGCAVVEVKIEGVLHEYDTLEGLQEDILAVLLNLRESAFSLLGNRDEVILELKANQVGPVTLDSIQLPHDVEIANPDHVIAHLTQPIHLNITLKVMRGQGIKRAESQQLSVASTEEVNTLYLDAIFNPIKRVSYQVKDARVGEHTDLDELIVYLETNGTITPMAAFQEAASILQEQGLSVILHYTAPEEKSMTVQDQNIDPVLLRSIEELELGARAAKCLKAEGIFFIGDLITKARDELLLTPNLGKRSLEEIEKALKEKSLSLGTSLPEWPPSGLHYPNEEDNEEVIVK